LGLLLFSFCYYFFFLGPGFQDLDSSPHNTNTHHTRSIALSLLWSLTPSLAPSTRKP
jgi:hypothetical protein